MSTLTFLYGGLGSAAIGGLWALRRWAMTWGMTNDELRHAWPGDDVSPRPIDTATRGVTIHAPISTVWAWLVQIGQDRAGFYSYTWLENLFRAAMPRVERLVPEWQERSVGDDVWLAHPGRYHGNARQRVVQMVPGAAMILASPADWGHYARHGANEDGTWSFTLVPIDSTTTRLIVRSRGPAKPSLIRRLFWFAAFDPAHFIMERRMMLRIKALAETTSQTDR
jgi:hypothetical protein